MTRHEFSMMVCNMLKAMQAEGLRPFIDFVKRSDEEQKRLFLLNMSKCDGLVKVSQHQRGKAVDIYLLSDTGKLIEWTTGAATYWHGWWTEHGGEPMLNWDLGHFETRP